MNRRWLTRAGIALALALLLAPIALAQTTTTMGETAILGSGDNGNRNLLLVQQATLTQTATLQSLSFYVTRTGGQLRLGVYDATGPNGGPGVKKAETAAFTPGLGWNTRQVSTPVLLPAGTYWLAYFPSSNRLAFRKQATGAARYYYRSFGTMPTTFSTSPSMETVHWSLYATLAASSGGTPAPTLSLSASPTMVQSGGSSTLTWSSTNAESCTASNVGAEGGPWSGAKPASGSAVLSPLTATATYALACTGPGGTANKSVVVEVSGPSPPTGITMGETTILGSGDNGNGNLLLVQQATLAQAGTLQSLSFYVTSAGGQLRLGVYDATGPNGGPGLKKAETAAFTPGVGWNTSSVTTPVSLPAGTYWLAYFPSSNALAFRKQLTGSARYYYRSFGTMPTTFSTSPSAEAVHWSLYATLTVSSGGTPAPTLSLSATPTTVASGGSSTLTWSSTNATSCIASNVGAEGSSWSGSKPTSGSAVLSALTATATYTLACTGPGGTASKSVTVTVSPAPAPTVSLTANPIIIDPGQATTLTWSSTNATGCTASGGWTGAQPLSGEVDAFTTATKTYTLTCTGPGGSAAKSVTVTVRTGPTQLTLTWVDNAGNAFFKIERKTGGNGTFGQIATTGLGAVSYVDTTPVTGSTYCYRVRASNANGDSGYSNEACATP